MLLNSISNDDGTIWENNQDSMDVGYVLTNTKAAMCTARRKSLVVYYPAPGRLGRPSLQYGVMGFTTDIELNDKENQGLVEAIATFLEKKSIDLKAQREEKEDKILSEILPFL